MTQACEKEKLLTARSQENQFMESRKPFEVILNEIAYYSEITAMVSTILSAS